MRAGLIPSDEIPAGAHRIVMAPPDGDLTRTDIAAAEMLVVRGLHGLEYSARMMLEPAEREAIAAGAPVWLTFVGSVPPFAAEVAEQ
ncbi:hypothetical protein [Actinophytocola sediminis]